MSSRKYKQNKTLPPEQQMITAQPDLLTETLCPGDEFIIMACDGVWDVMSNQDVTNFILNKITIYSLKTFYCSKRLIKCIYRSINFFLIMS